MTRLWYAQLLGAIGVGGAVLNIGLGQWGYAAICLGGGFYILLPWSHER